MGGWGRGTCGGGEGGFYLCLPEEEEELPFLLCVQEVTGRRSGEVALPATLKALQCVSVGEPGKEAATPANGWDGCLPHHSASLPAISYY